MITIKEEFLGSVKTKRAFKLGGYEAIVLWLSLKGYVSESNTGGFIPEEIIPDLPLVSKRWRRALDALLTCGKPNPDGTLGPGLVVRTGSGIELHDYEDHGTPPEAIEERRVRDRERKQLQRDRSRLRVLLVHQGLSTAEAAKRVRSLSRDDVTTAIVTMSRDVTSESQREGHVTSHRDSRPPARVRGRPPGSDPSPAQPSPAQPERDPPLPPLRRDRLVEQLTGIAPRDRPDVQRIFQRFKRAVGLSGLEIRRSHDPQAEILAEALDTHGEQACELVADECRHDRMVTGEADERGMAHKSVQYVFGNPTAFARILEAAKRKQRQRGRSAEEVMRAALEADADTSDLEIPQQTGGNP